MENYFTTTWKKINRSSIIISIGGGTLGDLSGFIASTILRGVKFFLIPTTLLSQVDSSIGGKNGINYKGIINSIGNYYHTDRVYISKNIINLIPEREYIAGIPEIW